MKELPGSWNPVAVFHSNKSCCKLRTIVSEWKQGRGLLRVPWSPLTWGSLSPAPAVFLTLLALWELTGHVSGSWRVNHNWTPLIQFRGLALVRLLSPFSLWGTERIKRRGGEGVAFGENFLPTEKLHFLPNPLLSFMASSSFSIRPLKEWVVRVWTGPLDSVSGGPSALEVCIREAMLSQAAEWCRVWADGFQTFTLVCPSMHPDLGEFLDPIERLLPGQKFCWPHPSSLQLSGSHGDGCLGVKSL